MCICLKDSLQRIVEKLKKDNDGKALIGSAEYKNTAISFSKGGGIFSYQELEYKFTPIKKNGENGRAINKTISIYHTFCPFCGEKYNKD